ncbi:peptide-methionine (S)-S-oxide reductase MsrA [Moraxellaceae bacterium AER2_44_116]|nr:peptide-methionine (S)-S-oxide reductase MsrA [Moraxellaceae bacterium]TQC98722.1 peptide-methionine (S)-S-oxide reductase MsrA [Moraxellaceae bacterium AER2_44_116]
MTTAVAIFGGGCFWCLEAVFQQVKGVHHVTSGYAGGARPNPTYEQICTGVSGHAEVVKLDFDPSIISFSQLLDVFYGIHDPTTLNRQGNDVGTQYRSVIYCQNAEQRQIAEAYIAELQSSGLVKSPIVTEVSDAVTFYPAEAYHQNYFANHPNQGYCQMVVAPKVHKLKQYFTEWVK